MRCPKCHHENPADTNFCGNCATQLQPLGEALFSHTMTLDTVQKIIARGSVFAGKYKILGELGRGGMGIVYRAEDTKLTRTVALKFLPPELSLYPEAKERFIREARAAAVLDHANICTVHEVEESEGITYIAMAYVEGQSLREKIAKHKLDLEQSAGIAVQVAEGLAEAHKKGIIHRDIKSANIMVKDDGQAKIMDFGLAKVAGESVLTREAKTMGTVAYMSPEQARGETVDHRTDIWSLGIVLYEMLTGYLPFRGERETSILYSIVHEEPKPLRALKPSTPVELIKIVERALKKDREARYSTAAEMALELRKFQEKRRAEKAGGFSWRSLLRGLRRPLVAIPTVLVLAVIALLAVWFFNRQAKIRWARNVALPEVQRLVEDGWQNFPQAYNLAVRAEKHIPKNPKLVDLFSKCSGGLNIQTNPPGARISIKPYTSPDSEWTFLGVSPVKDKRVARGFFHFRIEKEGYEPILCVRTTWDFDTKKGTFTPSKSIEIPLDKAGSILPGMIRVHGTDKIGDFFIDKFEVTNKQYKEFVDKGGYRKQEYWKHRFVKDAKELTWKEAMAEFVDQTGRPGPSTWEAGEYKKGQDDYPVGGVSWYEAAAFAEFAGKSLPTVSHWYIATGMDVFARGIIHSLIPLSNFDGEGPAAVGSHPGMVISGAYDMAGNVREWCWNESQKGRAIRGGAWNDVIYMFMAVTQAPPFDRSPRNGFRCARYIEPEKIPASAFEPTQLGERRDFYKEKPVPDDIFKVYKEQFSYDPHDLNAIVEKREETPEWVREKISFDASYANERMIAWLFLPKNGTPPYQTVIFFPGSDATWYDSSEIIEDSRYADYINFIVANGRAVLYPIYKGTYERKKDFPDAGSIHEGNETRRYTDYLIQVVKDFKRSIDYLESRKDINSERLAFYGASWGGMIANIILAVEERLKAGILVVGGLPDDRKVRPEADELNYVTRVKVPTLMLNGKYDVHAFPYETAVKPMYELLGTAKEDKRLVLFETDHFIPRNELIKQTLNWLDKYLGPVK
jgi:serine/threonine protein kinase/dienelactone hydrolase